MNRILSCVKHIKVWMNSDQSVRLLTGNTKGKSFSPHIVVRLVSGGGKDWSGTGSGGKIRVLDRKMSAGHDSVFFFCYLDKTVLLLSWSRV